MRHLRHPEAAALTQTHILLPGVLGGGNFATQPHFRSLMKPFSLFSLALLLLAFAGILSQHGRANAITYACCAPLAAWVLFLLVKAFTSK